MAEKIEDWRLIHALESGTGIILCIEKALAESEVARIDVNDMNKHPAYARTGDLKDYNVVIQCFGKKTAEVK